MLSFVKMCGVSAVLSFTLVTGWGHLTDAGAPLGSAKPFHQRLGESDIAIPAAADAATVPVAAAALKGDRLAETGKRRGDVRYVTVESREGVNVSVLQRLPQTEIASRQ